MSERPMDRDRWAFAVGVVVAFGLGVWLRALHLAIPLRYDEAVTFLDYASGGFAHAATHYPTPNNHVLNSLLIHGLTSVLGDHPWVIRLPAFAAGCLLVPAAAWMAARRFGARVGICAAFLVAAAPVLIEYSTNARGYSMVVLATVVAVGVADRLLDRRGGRPLGAGSPDGGGRAEGSQATGDPSPGAPAGLGTWAAYTVLIVFGAYTIPIMVLPWAGITLWLWVNLFVGGGTLRERLRREAPLIAATAAAGIAIALLYTPLVLESGLRALTGNRFVTPLGWKTFLGAIPSSVVEVAEHWARAVPTPLAVIAGLAVLAGLVLRPGRHRHGPEGRFPLGWSLLLGAVAIMLSKRNPGEARVWLWALPVVLTAAAAGLVAVLERTVRPSLAPRIAAAVSAAWAALVAAHLVVDRPLWRSLETGGFMEVEKVAAWLAERVEPEDAVVTDFVSWEPLRYYLRRHGIDPKTLDGPPDREGRAWILLNRNEEERTARAVRRAAGLGVPLETAKPMVTYGGSEIYGFGRGAR